MRKFGSGGSWKTFNEKKDSSVIQQISPLSCVAAVGEMLLQNRGISMTQAAILDIIGEASTTENLANLLNKVDKPHGNERWHGIVYFERS